MRGATHSAPRSLIHTTRRVYGEGGGDNACGTLGKMGLRDSLRGKIRHMALTIVFILVLL